MKIAAVSDIHGNLLALEAVLADIERKHVDVIVNLGDLLSGPLWPAETANRLMALNLPTIRGNHERQLSTLRREQMNASDSLAAAQLTQRHRAWLTELPETLPLAEDVLACHGTPYSDAVYFLEDLAGEKVVAAALDTVTERLGDCTSSMVLCGHTHIQRQVTLHTGQLIVNPGSVGLPAYDDDQPIYHKMESGTPHARYAIVSDVGKSDWRVDLRRVTYDFEKAAARAEKNARFDWAKALRTGYC